MSAFSLLFFDKCNTRTALSYMTADNGTYADNTALNKRNSFDIMSFDKYNA